MQRLIGTLAVLSLVVAGGFGCTSQMTFTTAARAGDTVSLAIGWRPALKRENLQIEFTPCVGQYFFDSVVLGGASAGECISVNAGPSVSYDPLDARVRAVTNLYPDPLSKFIVGGVDPINYNNAWQVQFAVTGGDQDFSEKFVIVDLPDTLPAGFAGVILTDVTTQEKIHGATVEILPGTVFHNSFFVNGVNIDDADIQEMERAAHHTITFSGSTVPFAIEVTLAHDSGVGVPYVVNPRGDMKSIAWSDDGTSLKVMLTPVNSQLGKMVDFKFFVAGGLTGVNASSVQAFNANGDLLAGVNATVE